VILKHSYIFLVSEFFLVLFLCGCLLSSFFYL
jgi:hypothetical protein